MTTNITCPSGLSGQIRGMKVKEERILADRKLSKSGSQLDELLSACWLETIDSGPYEFKNGNVDWKKVLQGDRFYTLLQIRTATYGSEMSSQVVKEFCQLDTASEQIMKSAVEQMHLSARAYFRILKLARTIADLASVNDIQAQHVAEALQYRPKHT